ncbi:hypothetical protein SDC9_183419 [bioreactor metagenome]|uniref:Uncharacterized protein n=1 Tax=bioreactor metagenome TaxID=1076179 RepID=A0A645HBL5_9ZZZZ
MDTISTPRMTSVSDQLIVSIMMKTPTSVVIDVMIWVRLWFRLVFSVSTSFVILESTSPWLFLWK